MIEPHSVTTSSSLPRHALVCSDRTVRSLSREIPTRNGAMASVVGSVAVEPLFVGDLVRDGRARAAAFGSTDPAVIAFWCIVLGISLIFASPRGLRRAHFAVLGGVAVIVLAYAFVLHEQLSPHPFIASPHPLWRKASEALGTPLRPAVSIARNQPFFALGAPLAAILSLVCSVIVCANRDRARQLLKVIAWSGAAYAVFGIVAFLIDPTKTLWRESAYPKVLTSTFVNANTAAAYFGSCSVVWLLILSEAIRRHAPDGLADWRALVNRLFTHFRREIVAPFSMLFVCLTAMFMTGSRAGVTVSLIALVIAFMGIFHRDLSRLGNRLLALIVVGAIALLLLQIMGAGVSGRFESEGLANGGRFANLSLDLADDRRPSLVWDGPGDLRVEFPGLSQRGLFNVRDMGSSSRYSSRDCR